MRHLRVVTRLTALAVVTLVGAGACASGPRQDGTGVDGQPVAAAEQTTGAGASPEPSQTPSPKPSRTSSPGPSRTSAPSPSATRSTGPTNPAPTRTSAGEPDHGCPVGERQQEVETYLVKLGGFGEITVDGQQSAADCAAIKKFQKRYGIQPAAGRAGPTTFDVAKRLATTDTSKCKAGKGMTFCVDLTHQTVWAMRDGVVVMKPTVTRTGMPGYQTPPGTYTINYRSIREWSHPYKVWLPYWQHFNNGMGFHETTTYLHEMSIGSHGCVNLLPSDARTMWELGKVGVRVHVFGRRPGT